MADLVKKPKTPKRTPLVAHPWLAPHSPQRITLVTGSPKLTVNALRGNTAPAPTGGYGGWTQVPRPHRKALTVWDGVEPFQQAFSLIFDGVSGDTSVEDGCRTLERMAQPTGDRQEPPLVRVLGAVPHPGLYYVIDSLDWDPAPFWSLRGYRTRQEVTVHLLEYVRPDRAAQNPGAEAARRKAVTNAAAAAQIYVVRRGDLKGGLSGIAANQLGDYKRWPEIARLNTVRDPKRLKVGQRLKLP
jgi:hypothetical protein